MTIQAICPVSEGGLEPSAPPVLVERESGRNRGLTCGVRENERPDADRCAPLPRIGATTGGTDDLDPAGPYRAPFYRPYGAAKDALCSFQGRVVAIGSGDRGGPAHRSGFTLKVWF